MTNTQKLEKLLISHKKTSGYEIFQDIIKLLKIKTDFSKIKYKYYIRVEVQNGKCIFIQDMLDNEEADKFVEYANDLLEEQKLII